MIGLKVQEGLALGFMLSVVKVKVKEKLKFTLSQASKAQRGSGGIALLFF